MLTPPISHPSSLRSVAKDNSRQIRTVPTKKIARRKITRGINEDTTVMDAHTRNWVKPPSQKRRGTLSTKIVGNLGDKARRNHFGRHSGTLAAVCLRTNHFMPSPVRVRQASLQ